MEGNRALLFELGWWVLIMGLIGHFLGKRRGQPGAGAMASIFLGPIGWIMILAGRDDRPKCPECLGVVPAEARRCMHCGSAIVHSDPLAELKAPAKMMRCPRCGEKDVPKPAGEWDRMECPTCKHVFGTEVGKPAEVSVVQE